MNCGFCRSARDETMLIVVEPVALIGVPFESAKDDFLKNLARMFTTLIGRKLLRLE
jgi:hypothetical protein